MRYGVTILLLLFAQFFSLSAAIANSDFNSYYDLAIQDRLNSFTFEERERAKDIHFVLMPGLMGHLSNWKRIVPSLLQYNFLIRMFDRYTPVYFKEFGEVLRDELGAEFTILHRRTKHDFVANAEYLYGEILKLSEKLHSQGNFKKLVLIGHSKGGLDASLVLLTHSPRLRNIVDYDLSVQSPFMGAHGRPMHLPARIQERICSTCLEKVDEMIPHAIVPIFKEATRKFWTDNFTDYERASRKFGTIATYVTSPKDVSWMSWSIQKIIRTKLKGHINDGLLRTRDQVLDFSVGSVKSDDPEIEWDLLKKLRPEVGKLWGYIEADHCDLFLGWGIYSMKEFYSPWGYFTQYPKDFAAASLRRTQFARALLKFYLDAGPANIQ